VLYEAFFISCLWALSSYNQWSYIIIVFIFAIRKNHYLEYERKQIFSSSLLSRDIISHVAELNAKHMLYWWFQLIDNETFYGSWLWLLSFQLYMYTVCLKRWEQLLSILWIHEEPQWSWLIFSRSGSDYRSKWKLILFLLPILEKIIVFDC
jgi:hypothetical protein